MEKYELIAPCHFGLEAVLKKEVLDLGYEITKVEDGKVTMEGDAEAICRANIWLRTAERVLLKAGEFEAVTFDQLFESVKSIPWEKYIPKNGKFWVTKANSVNSKLFSPSDIQSIVKKAMVERLKEKYKMDWFPEDGDEYPIRISILKDQVTIGLDTTGSSLHKRGYRPVAGKAPISESLAAALILLTPWRRERILVDPFCGSGTFVIEAAMIAANIAPGIKRHFTAEHWSNLIPQEEWEEVRQDAIEACQKDIQVDIQGYDLDKEVIRIARENAKAAGVEHLIHLQQRGIDQLSHPGKYGFIITNPPYGERLEEKKDLPDIYATLGRQFRALDSWSAYVITSYEDTEKYMGRKADKNRKIYNGMLKTYFYQFMGPKPPRRNKDDKQ